MFALCKNLGVCTKCKVEARIRRARCVGRPMTDKDEASYRRVEKEQLDFSVPCVNFFTLVAPLVLLAILGAEQLHNSVKTSPVPWGILKMWRGDASPTQTAGVLAVVFAIRVLFTLFEWWLVKRGLTATVVRAEVGDRRRAFSPSDTLLRAQKNQNAAARKREPSDEVKEVANLLLGGDKTDRVVTLVMFAYLTYNLVLGLTLWGKGPYLAQQASFMPTAQPTAVPSGW